MKKVLFIGPFPPPYNGQSVAFSYLKQLDRDIFDLEFYNTHQYSNNFLNYFSSTLLLPLKILLYDYALIYFIGSRSIPGFIRQLPFFLTTIILGKKVINHLHGADFKNFFLNSGFLKPLIRFCYNHIDTTIILLKGMKSQYADFPKMKIKVVPNAFNLKLDDNKFHFPKPKNVLYLSNLIASKGILEFLEAADLLLKVDKDLTVSIAGNFLGDHIKKTDQIKEEFYAQYHPLKDKYQERINYLGLVVGDQKRELLINSSLFVLPTYYPTEAFPISIIEAMRTGNAIITTKHNYLEELISEENGTLIKAKSAQEIFKASKRLMENKKLLEQIQKHNMDAAKQYTLENHLLKIKNILRHAL